MYIDQARFLTLQSGELLRRSVVQVAATRADEARGFNPGETQEDRDHRYLYSFFGRDFVEELNAWQGTALGMAHTLKQSAFFRPANVSKKVKGLFYAGHNSLPGIGLPMCLIGAELVYKRLVGDKSAGPTPHEIKPLPNDAWVGLK